MKKPKKPDYKKWVNQKSLEWWQAICLLSEIDPPKDLVGYLKLRSEYKLLKDREDEFIEKGVFKEFGIDPIFINQDNIGDKIQ